MSEMYYTIETRLELKENKELREYLDSYVTFYNEVARYVWRQITSPNFIRIYKSKAKFNTYISQKYNLLIRTVKSIVNEVEGRIKALKELKKHELSQLKLKVKSLTKREKEYKGVLNKLKPFIRDNKITKSQLKTYKRNKQKLFYLQRNINKKQNKLDQLKYNIKNNKLKICFGSKNLFSKQHRLKENNFKSHKGWYNEFVKCRDKNIYYRGSSDETQGNQMLQLKYKEEEDTFEIQVRKENKYSDDSKYIKGDCNFKYQKEHLKEMLEGGYPLNYRFVRRCKNKWYLQVMLLIKREKYLTRSNEGVLGLDYNEGFVELSETDKQGNLINQKQYKIDNTGTSNKAKDKMRKLVNKVCKYALAVGKDIVIEDLDFKGVKGKTIVATSKSGKKYNRMLHKLDYSRYKETFKGTTHRLGIGLVLVDPRNTSKIGGRKYSKSKKLSVHQSASYVIGRRGQGFRDKLISK